MPAIEPFNLRIKNNLDIKIPNLSLVVLIGPSGAGKSTFAREHFLPTEILSSDYCRGLVSDDENNQAATTDAFEVLHYIAAKRLERGRLTVIDATNVQLEARKPLVQLARQYHCLPVAVVLNLPEQVCVSRNRERDDRNFAPRVVRHQRSQLRRSLKALRREGFRKIFVLESPADVEAAVVTRERLWNDKRDERGPFDIIGDVHGCGEELQALLERLGYEPIQIESPPGWGNPSYRHPDGRRAFFVGDLVDRGPRILDVLRIARNMVATGDALCVPGNHDMKLLRKLNGRNVRVAHGLQETLDEIASLPDETREAFCQELIRFLDGLVSHYVLDEGKLVVAHAGMKEAMQGRGSKQVREFALYGETTGETDELGLPVRYNWAADYRGSAMVVYGHTPVPEPEWLNRTINVDTGCVFGGRLTALRYPEQELISVPARELYCAPTRPFLPETRADDLSAQQLHDDLLDADDVRGKRTISTRLQHNVTIREENSTAALEVMSRFAANPQWLIYLPPTMSPSETSTEAGFLEHPQEALNYYRQQGVTQVICEEKHMGSRAVVIVCRDHEAARNRFGVTTGERGIVYTRTGRRFFQDPELESEFIERLRAAMTASGFWEQFSTSWACLDCELMPWSSKAQELLRSQYAAVGAAGRAALDAAVPRLQQASSHLTDNELTLATEVLARFEQRQQNVTRFTQAYRQYCWPVESLADLRLAPFHLLATEDHVHIDQPHTWHMQQLHDLCEKDPELLLATQFETCSLADEGSIRDSIRWWEELTQQGGEGMVVKPLEWIARGPKGLVQPAIKCRGREYLRIIYGPDYDADEHLHRLRRRSLGRKRSLALREFALGIDALERFVKREPLRRVHECVFGVLALESEPVDPRL